MLSVVPAQCLGYAAKKLLASSTGFSCYSTLRKCTSSVDQALLVKRRLLFERSRKLIWTSDAVARRCALAKET